MGWNGKRIDVSATAANTETSVKHLAAFFAALIAAGLGAYILWQFHTNTGLICGGLCVLLGVGIALPVQLNSGAVALKGVLVLLIPVVKGAIPGGQRADDPPKEG